MLPPNAPPQVIKTWRRPELLVVAAAFLWSSGGLGVKSIAHLPALAIAGLRGFFAAVAMAGVTAWMARRESTRVLALLRRPWVLGAALAYALTVVSFVLSARLTTATNAILIQYTGPVYVAVLSWPLLGERPRPIDWLAMAGCMLGMLVCVSGEMQGLLGAGGVSASVRGIGFAVLSSLGFAALPLCLRLDLRRGGQSAVAPMAAMTLGNALAALAMAWAPRAVLGVDGRDLAIAASLGIAQIAIPYVLYGLAVQRMSALKSSLLAFVEPVLTPLWVFLGVGEIPSAAAGVGGAIILAALALQSSRKNPHVVQAIPAPAAL